MLGRVTKTRAGPSPVDVDDPGIVLIDAVEDFQPVLAELPGTEKVVFLIFFFGGLLFFRALIETSALGCRQQSVNLTPILIHLATPVLLTMMDRMMGGEGEPDDSLDPDYKLTDLELNMYADSCLISTTSPTLRW